MRLFIFTLLTLSFFSCTNSDTGEKSQSGGNVINIIDRAMVPEFVAEYLHKKYPEWQLPDTTDYIKSWWSFYEKGTIPYYVTVDINDDKKIDHAILLKAKHDLRLVFIIDSAGIFTSRVIPDIIETFQGTVKDIQYGLAIEYPGRIDCVVNGFDQSLVLKTNAVSVMNYEFKDLTYYLEDNDFKKFRHR